MSQTNSNRQYKWEIQCLIYLSTNTIHLQRILIDC